MSNILVENISEIWSELEDYTTTDSNKWRSRTLEVKAGDRSVLLALDEMGHRHLLVPQGSTFLPANTRSPLAVSSQKFQFGPDEINMHGNYLDIQCQLPRLNTQFDTVVVDIVHQIESSTDPAAAAFSTVSSWRRLFMNLAAAPAMSYKDRLAAFGELTFLQELAESRYDFQATWWTGPERESHDFALPTVEFEMKTVGEESDTVTVHGLDQLAKHDRIPLYLLVRTVVEDPEGRSVGEVLSEIIAGCQCAGEIREEAALVGISADEEDTVRFKVISTQVAQVTSNFPRITRNQLKDSVTDAVQRVEYDLSLRALKPHLENMPLSKMEEIING